jgi:hypothetical protein
MKKILLVIFLMLLLGGTILIAPFALFLHHIYTLDLSEESLYEQVEMLSFFSFSEEADGTDSSTAAEGQVFMITVTDEDLGTMLHHALAKNPSPLITVSNVTTTISPEMIFLEISLQFGLSGYQIFETAVFSEWRARISQGASDTYKNPLIEIKPVDIHTTVLHTLNFARFWKYATQTETSDGWLALPSLSSHFDIQYVVLQDHEISISLEI